jgi:hypothetical protein
MQYVMDKNGGMPLVCARNVMVMAEYKIRSHTSMDMMVPAGSFRLSQIPDSSVVPVEQDQLKSLK